MTASSSRLAAVPVVPLLLLLLLWSVALLGGVVNGQQGEACQLVLGGVSPQPSDATHSLFVDTIDIYGFTASSSSTINTLSIYLVYSPTRTAAMVRLGLYTIEDNTYILQATAQLIEFSNSPTSSGAYSGRLTDAITGVPTTYTLTAGTTYHIAALPSADIVILQRNDATNGRFRTVGSAYPDGLLHDYSANSNNIALTADLAALSCTYAASGNGDPLFTGFLGQQFYISGVDGGVMTVIAAANMQLNARLVQLEEGTSMLPYEQDKLREASELRHTSGNTDLTSSTDSTSATTPPSLPRTTAWTHPGTYFGEIGVALLDDNTVHCKAGSYEQGWAAVTLNQRPLPVSDLPVVIGQGANTTYIHRVSDHQLIVRTYTLQLTLVNSDHFLNIERVQLEKGYSHKTRLGGILGGTADPSWTWQPAVEADNTVASNDLFDRAQMEM